MRYFSSYWQFSQLPHNVSRYASWGKGVRVTCRMNNTSKMLFLRSMTVNKMLFIPSMNNEQWHNTKLHYPCNSTIRVTEITSKISARGTGMYWMYWMFWTVLSQRVQERLLWCWWVWDWNTEKRGRGSDNRYIRLAVESCFGSYRRQASRKYFWEKQQTVNLKWNFSIKIRSQIQERPEACEERCQKIHYRSLERAGFSPARADSIIEKQRPAESVKPMCWSVMNRQFCESWIQSHIFSKDSHVVEF